VGSATVGNVDIGAQATPTATSIPASIDTPAQAAPIDRSGWPVIDSISLVIPVYNEEGNLEELHRRLTDVLSGTIQLPYEIIFVDDGSKDATWSIIRVLRQSDPHVLGLRHRRNFGKARALSHGFAAASGSAIVTMDGDLQDDPDELPRFIETLNNGYDLASGWKQRRQDPLGKTAPSKVFNWTVRKVTGVQLHDFNCGFKAYRRDAAKSIRLYGELHRFTPVLANAEGFRIAEIPVKHHPRTWGQSKYGWSRLVKGFLDLLTVFFLTEYRQRPMHLFGLPGLLSGFVGVVIGLFLTYERLILDNRIGTRPLLMLAVLLVVIGVQFFGLGLLGEFLAHGSNSRHDDPADATRETLGLGPDHSLLPPAA
jgi:glycosyltransferase involved in cell wall biosynthesis